MRKITLSYAPGLEQTGEFATIWSDGTVLGDDPLAKEYRRDIMKRLDFNLPPDERLLKFVGSPTYVLVSEPSDVGS